MSIIRWLKVLLFALLGALLVAVKVLAGRNSKLKKQVETKERQLELKDDQQKVKDEVLEDEPKQVEDLKKDDGRSRADRINGLFNNPDA